MLLTQLLRETSVLILGQQPLPFMVGGGLSGGASTQQVVWQGRAETHSGERWV